MSEEFELELGMLCRDSLLLVAEAVSNDDLVSFSLCCKAFNGVRVSARRGLCTDSAHPTSRLQLLSKRRNRHRSRQGSRK